LAGVANKRKKEKKKNNIYALDGNSSLKKTSEKTLKKL